MIDRIARPSESSILSQPTSALTGFSNAFNNAMYSVPLRLDGSVFTIVVPVDRVDETYLLNEG